MKAQTILCKEFAWIIVTLSGILLTSCESQTNRSTEGDRIDLQSRIVIEDSVFTGGYIYVEEVNGKMEAVDYVDLSFFDGENWVIIDRDWATVADINDRDEKFAFWWDLSDLPPGRYELRSEMHGYGKAYDQVKEKVQIAHKPIGRVLLGESNKGVVVFTANEFLDVTGAPLTHSWKLDSGDVLTGPTIEVSLQPENLPVLFTHTVTNLYGASLSNTYLFNQGLLFSLVDLEISVNLGVWRTKLTEIIKEKEQLKPKLNPQNQKHIDEANAKLKEAAKKLKEARDQLNKKPPNQQAAKTALKAAKKLIDEAIEIFRKVDQQNAIIEANIKQLNELMQNVAVSLLETDYLIDRINAISAIIADKKAIVGLDAANKKVRDQIVTLLEAAEKLLGEAKTELLNTPTGIKTAKEKIDKARTKIKEAGKLLEKAKPVVPQFTANIERLKLLYLKLGFLSGKLWLLEEITLSNPHADIPLPNLTRKHSTSYWPYGMDIEMGKINDPLGDDGWDNDVMYHELDHHFIYQKNKKNAPGDHHYFDEDLDKTYGKATGKKLAWSEGWANFSSCAKRKSPKYLDEDEEKRPPGPKSHFTIEKDLENDQCRNPGEKKMHKIVNEGPAVEGLVSGILWDLFDGGANPGVADVDKDGISIRFIHIWEAINLKPYPEDILEFHDRLEKVLKQNGVVYDKVKFKEIFTNHTVNPK